jgi:hypothetical protein
LFFAGSDSVESVTQPVDAVFIMENNDRRHLSVLFGVFGHDFRPNASPRLGASICPDSGD